MLLAVDVGNTNISFGIFDGDRLVESFRMTTQQRRTSDEFGVIMTGIMLRRGIRAEQIKHAIIASVVPDVMYSLTNGIIKSFGTLPLVVEPGVKTGIRLAVANPREIGADRIVDVVAGYELYGGPVLVIDYGTATTYDLVDEKGAFFVGITAPGIETSAKALWEGAAKLPKIAMEKPDTILANDTITSMQAGLIYGNIGQTEYIIKKVKEEAGLDRMKVVATGGLGKLIADETNYIDEYDINLTMTGLRLIYNKNKKQ